MAQRRMFSPDIVDSDAFLDMPSTSQLLYFHLAMRADDDGFISPKKIMRLVGAGDDDLKVLLTKRFVLPFESGVVVIKHWLIHNLIRKDRYKETRYIEEKKLLKVKENGAYTELTTSGLPYGNQMAPQVRLGKVRLGEENTSEIPKRDGIKTLKEGYMSKFKVDSPSKIHSSKDLLATEIYEWAGKKLSYPMLRRLINLKGEQFIRECWADVKQSDAKEPHKLFMHKLATPLKVKTVWT